jgi:site-specific DNA-cytosine methylase
MSIEEREIRHFHLFAGMGGGALGFNRGRAELNGLRAKFRCIGGVDISPAAMRDFYKLSGTRGSVLDMFDREQYTAFHGVEPPSCWKECTPQDIRTAAGGEFPHIVFLSAPCKGFSGLLSETRSKTDKYQALNRLTLRGVFLMLESFRDNLPELIIFENVPRIATRGRALLDQIGSVLRHYGYAVAETFHDCGEIGGLAQSRKRFLMVARHVEKVRPFLYEPPIRPLRAVGTILEKFPMPGDMRGGPMHALPNLQWKTWVRLAFVEAGSDWRSLKKLKVVDGKLAEYALLPERQFGGGPYGVTPWDASSGTVTGMAAPTRGAFSVADPRFEGHEYSQHGVRGWNETSGAIARGTNPGQGVYSVADPRLHGKNGDRYSDVYRVIRWEEASRAISGGKGPSAGGLNIADPRWPNSQGDHDGKYYVQGWDASSKTITGADRIGSGALCVADPRPEWQNRYGNLQVADWGEPSSTVIAGGKGVQGGWLSVADPRITNERVKGDHYLTNGHYGVTRWDASSGAVSAAASADNGRWSVADPRIDSLPDASQKLVARIRSLDNTWHRPFTTLELAALQSLIEPEDIFDLDGDSDGAKRERIGNAVPSAAAQAIADLMAQTLLLAWSGQSFALSAQSIWVQPVAVALSVQPATGRELA